MSLSHPVSRPGERGGWFDSSKSAVRDDGALRAQKVGNRASGGWRIQGWGRRRYRRDEEAEEHGYATCGQQRGWPPKGRVLDGNS